MLEEAACDSSFCSSSSKVKQLIGRNKKETMATMAMPSPIPKANGLTSASSTQLRGE